MAYVKILTRESKFSDVIGIISLKSVLAIIILVFLVYLFFTTKMMRFYASALFSFYYLTKTMWISVVLLGVFQTIVLIPLRIFRLIQGDTITEFQEKVEVMKTPMIQRDQFKKEFHFGNPTFLYYLVEFMIQLTTFLTIGRLFLTDFYSNALNRTLLYDFVPYPQYPIQSTWFKIPYIGLAGKTDLGWSSVIQVWLLILLIQIVIWVIRYLTRKNQDHKIAASGKLSARYSYGYFLIFIILSWLLLRNFPTGFAFKIFTGDVSIPNRTLNIITAIATFGMLLWFGYQRIQRKVKLAKAKGIEDRVIELTKQQMFASAFKDAVLVGLGAYFITNHIPSAFELSVFTLEIISLSAPFTLDKFILKLKPSKI